MASNIEFQEQLNKLIQDQLKLMEQKAKLEQDSLSRMKAMADAIKQVNFKDATEQMGELKAASEKATESGTKLGTTNAEAARNVTKAMQESADTTKQLGGSLSEAEKRMLKFGLVAASAMDGLRSGMGFSLSLFRSGISLALGLTKGIFNIGKAIITAPFKMLSALMQDATGGSNELQQAIEDVRKEFGDLREATGKATLDMAKNLKGELANTGLSVYKVFGNLAERLRTMLEYMKELGPTANMLAGQMAQNAEAIGAFHKGLGLTAEGFKALGSRALATGVPLTEQMRDMANYSLQLGKAFNISSKEISRDMANMMADFSHFGHLGTKTLSQISVYTKRLGIEFKSLLGVMDKFANFEDAAQGAAQLSQAFGLNINAIELMKEQDPAKKVEMLRKAFFAAGRSVENMTYQERRLLAAQSGVSEESLNLVFSLKNQNLSYAEVQKRSEAAKKHQLSQVEVLKQLAGAIERLTKSGGGGASSFFEIWLKGFRNGIRTSTEFRGLMRNLQIDMRATFIEGRKVGRMFVESFPGVKAFLGGLRDLFNPQNFRAMLGGTTKAFREFFDHFTKDPQGSLKALLDQLKHVFRDWLNLNSPNGSKMLEGVKSFFKAMSNVTAGLLKQGMIGLTKGITLIVDLLAGRQSIAGLINGARASGGFFGQMLGPILEAIKDAGPNLWSALKVLFAELFVKLKEFLGNHWLGLATFFGGPALTGALARAVTAGFGTALVGGIANWFKSGGARTIMDRIKNPLASTVEQIEKSAQRLPNIPAVPEAARAGTGSAAVSAISATDQAAQAARSSKVGSSDGMKLAIIAGVIIVGLIAVMAAVYVLAKKIQENHIQPQALIAAGAVTLVAAGAIMAAAAAVKMISATNVGPGDLRGILMSMIPLGLTIAAMAGVAYLMVRMFKSFSIGDAAKAALVMGATGVLFLAASGVVLIGSAIGAIAASGVGAALILAGVALIGTVVAAMATGAMVLMQQINRFRPEPGFKEKSKAFMDIITGVGAFAANISSIIDSTRPSFAAIVFGNPEQEMRQNLDKVMQLIRTLSGEMINIVNSIVGALGQLSGGEEQLRKAQILGTLLTGVGQLAQALQPSSQALQEPGFWQSLNGDSVSRRISLMADYVNSTGIQLRQFVHAIANILGSELSNGINENQKRAIEVMPALLKGVGDLAQALMPRSTTIEQLNHSADFAGALQHMGNFMREMIRSVVQTGLFEQIGNTIAAVAGALVSANITPRQLEALKAGLPAMSAAFTGLGNIAMAVANLAQGNAAQTSGNIYQATQFVSTLLNSLSHDLPEVVKGMAASFAGINANQARAASQGIQAVAEIINTISHVDLQHVPTTQAIHDMITHINEVGAELTRIRPMNINAGLRRLASNLGLGNNEEFTINHRNFNVQIQLNVRIDAEDLERVLIDRPNTRFGHTANTRSGQ
jgi:hypothetical protein